MAKAPDTTAAAMPAGPPPAADPSFAARPLRSFALFVALPILLLYLTSVALVIAALAIMAGEMDRLEMQRSITTMHAALGSVLNDLSGAVTDEGTWDEAYLNVVVHADAAWLDTTWGATARLGQSYDSVLVTDQAGAVIFGQGPSGPISGNIGTRIPAARTMLASLDKGIAATGDATSVSSFTTDADGSLGLAAISIHKSSPGQPAVARDARRILWIGRHLTPGLLQDIAVRYQSPLATLGAAPAAGLSAMTISDADGKPVGTFAWTPDRPGQAAFGNALVIASIVLFAIGVLLAFALAAIRRAFIRRLAPVAAPPRSAAASPTTAAAAIVAHAAAIVAGEPSPIRGVNAADFSIEYQPILDLRWTAPDGSVLTQESLPSADRARLLDRVGIIALRRVATEIAPLLGITVTLAVTPGQLQSDVYAEKVLGTLGATSLPAARLTLALAAAQLPPLAAITPAIRQLRQLGVGVALADFAIDPATAACLDAQLVDRARLATALTAPAGSGPAQEALLAATLDAARSAGLAITVPGLVQREQAARLLRLGCREFQGELLAPPLPLAALTQLVLAPAKPAARKAG